MKRDDNIFPVTILDNIWKLQNQCDCCTNKWL